MFDLARFYELSTPERTIGRTLHYQPVVGSTMDVARTLAQAGAAHGLVVLADEQTQGRGRFARRWVAPAGTNLTFTILLRPSTAVLASLSMIAALAVADGVAATSNLHPAFKWPNDLLLGARKLAGILIESEFQGDRPAFALVGIGLNVNMASAVNAETATVAVSLRDLLGHDTPREELLAAVLLAFERWSDSADADGAAVVEAWSSRLTTLGQAVEVSFAGRIERGVAERVTGSGALILRRPDGSEVTLPAGEVSLRPGPRNPPPDPLPEGRESQSELPPHEAPPP